jgi:hypothetical protein
MAANATPVIHQMRFAISSLMPAFASVSIPEIIGPCNLMISGVLQNISEKAQPLRASHISDASLVSRQVKSL